MALLNPLTPSPPSSYPSQSPSLYFLSLQSQKHSSNSFTTLKFKCYSSSSSSSSSSHTVPVDTQQTRRVAPNPAKSRRKPRPSFYEQIQDKWSSKIASPRRHLPWQVQEQKPEAQEKGEVEEIEEQNEPLSAVVQSKQVSFGLLNRSISAPWVRVSKPQADSVAKISEESGVECKYVNGFQRRSEENVGRGVVERSKNFIEDVCDGKFEEDTVRIDETPIGLLGDIDVLLGKGSNGVSSIKKQFGNVELSSDDNGSSIGLPWKSEKEVKGVDRWMKNKTEVAEKLIPQHELKRLKNAALRMVERIKVGEAGVTQALVDSIHDKWEKDEVVKLKFEGISTLNMKRIHEILEKRTGGLVIWRSGSSIVLFRGMTYKLHCAKSYTKQNKDNMNVSQYPKDIVSVVTQTKEVKESVSTMETYIPNSARYLKDLSEEELMDFNELNLLLDDLGPRFKDWSGREPLPIDADLLPPVIPGYKAPFRILPFGARHSLKNKEMTYFRRLSRIMPPHFALGRSRELQGLARAIVKLWERSAVAKIAIKRGVLNTLNERMSEEIKKLTGGTLLSRNKDYIVFYRGNDFMPPAVTKALKERQQQTELCQDEEELVRQRASTFTDSNMKFNKGPLVAGTLAETMAATSQWRSQLSSEDVEKMIRDSALAKHVSLVRYLEKKLNLAKEKAKKAEKALKKVQEYLEPAELPTDLEILSDEERFLFRKMGLSMKPFLLLGTRGVFDGTIENMHLHWKFRELVKIIVKGKNFAQVKHIAISLEAESGGVLVSVDKTTKGYAIIVYRGKNYQRPSAIRPRNLLTRRQALARSIELQRREALKHHIMDLEEQIELLKSDLEDMKSLKEVDGKTLNSRLNVDILSAYDDIEEDEGEEAYLGVYESVDEGSNVEDEEFIPEK